MDRGWFAGVLVSSLVLNSVSAATAQDGGKIPWNHDPKSALKEAKKSGKPMMLFFTSYG